MTQALRGSFDLNQVRERLIHSEGYKDMVAHLDRCTHQNSVAEDLRIAIQLLNTLIGMGPGSPHAPALPSDDLIRQSLFVHLVILYARSVDSQDKGRSKKGGPGRAFGPARRLAHGRIMKIRDKVVAHHGDPKDQDWTDDRLVVSIAERVVQYRSVFSRRLATREALKDLGELLPVAYEHFRQRAAEAENAFHTALSERIETDQILWDAVAASPFSPDTYFGAGDVADNFLIEGKRGDGFGQVRWTRSPD